MAALFPQASVCLKPQLLNISASPASCVNFIIYYNYNLLFIYYYLTHSTSQLVIVALGTLQSVENCNLSQVLLNVKYSVKYIPLFNLKIIDRVFALME